MNPLVELLKQYVIEHPNYDEFLCVFLAVQLRPDADEIEMVLNSELDKYVFDLCGQLATSPYRRTPFTYCALHDLGVTNASDLHPRQLGEYIKLKSVHRAHFVNRILSKAAD